MLFVNVLVLSVSGGCEDAVRVATGGGIASVRVGFAGSSLDAGRSFRTLAGRQPSELAVCGVACIELSSFDKACRPVFAAAGLCLDNLRVVAVLLGRDIATPIVFRSML